MQNIIQASETARFTTNMLVGVRKLFQKHFICCTPLINLEEQSRLNFTRTILHVEQLHQPFVDTKLKRTAIH